MRRTVGSLVRRSNLAAAIAVAVSAGTLAAVIGLPNGERAASSETVVASPPISSAADVIDTTRTPSEAVVTPTVSPSRTAAATPTRTSTTLPRSPKTAPETATATPTASRTIEATPTTVAISVKTYEYGTHERHRLDVLASTALAGATEKTRRPTVVLVHGGSWVKGDKSAMHEAAEDLVTEGYVAIPVNYRLAGQAAWPAQREDVRHAIRWIREHAALLHVDVSRIVVLGSSAGAEIAAAALTGGDGSRYARGLVTLSGPIDLELVTAGAGSLARIITEQLLRCAPDDCAQRLRASSAIHRYDSHDPASLIIASRYEWVDPRSSYRFHEAAVAVGVDSELHVLPGRQHGMDTWDRAWPTIRRWIADRTSAMNQ